MSFANDFKKDRDAADKKQTSYDCCHEKTINRIETEWINPDTGKKYIPGIKILRRLAKENGVDEKRYTKYLNTNEILDNIMNFTKMNSGTGGSYIVDALGNGGDIRFHYWLMENKEQHDIMIKAKEYLQKLEQKYKSNNKMINIEHTSEAIDRFLANFNHYGISLFFKTYYINIDYNSYKPNDTNQNQNYPQEYVFGSSGKLIHHFTCISNNSDTKRLMNIKSVGLKSDSIVLQFYESEILSNKDKKYKIEYEKDGHFDKVIEKWNHRKEAEKIGFFLASLQLNKRDRQLLKRDSYFGNFITINNNCEPKGNHYTSKIHHYEYFSNNDTSFRTHWCWMWIDDLEYEELINWEEVGDDEAGPTYYSTNDFIQKIKTRNYNEQDMQKGKEKLLNLLDACKMKNNKLEKNSSNQYFSDYLYEIKNYPDIVLNKKEEK